MNPLDNDLTWTDGAGLTHDLDRMDPDHRANLIPFLRRNIFGLYRLYGPPIGPTTEPSDIERWLEDTPLMRRLTELERGRSIDERRATAERNRAYERATGYVKIGPAA